MENPEAPGEDTATIYRERRFLEVYTLTDTATGDPIDLTGCSVSMHMRRIPSGKRVKDLAPTITDATAGEITVDISDAFTGVADGTYKADLIITDADAKKLRPHLRVTLTLETLYTHA